MLRSGILEYAQDLKRQGTIHHIGFSTHNPHIARKLIDTGEVDLFMFSINPAYDLDSTNNDDVDALFKGMTGDTLGIAPLRAGLSNSRTVVWDRSDSQVCAAPSVHPYRHGSCRHW